ncbi:MAG: hypothetical protein FJ149_01195 [Euryarchaeota archaeon]|nr:hypothetical protein [Euryarchaeota archaeon]
MLPCCLPSCLPPFLPSCLPFCLAAFLPCCLPAFPCCLAALLPCCPFPLLHRERKLLSIRVRFYDIIYI